MLDDEPSPLLVEVVEVSPDPPPPPPEPSEESELEPSDPVLVPEDPELEGELCEPSELSLEAAFGPEPLDPPSPLLLASLLTSAPSRAWPPSPSSALR